MHIENKRAGVGNFAKAKNRGEFLRGNKYLAKGEKRGRRAC